MYLVVAFGKDDEQKEIEYVRSFADYENAHNALDLLHDDNSFYWCMLLDTSSKTEIYG